MDSLATMLNDATLAVREWASRPPYERPLPPMGVPSKLED